MNVIRLSILIEYIKNYRPLAKSRSFIGKEISIKKKENNYGKDFYNKLSSDLGKELPEVKSFSATNLRYMKRFYEFYPNARKLPQFAAVSRENQNLPQLVADFEQQTSIVLTSDDSDQLVFNIPS